MRSRYETNNIPTEYNKLYTVKKSLRLLTEYFGYEYELLHHINTSYNSYASIYIFWIDAFFISQVGFEKRNKHLFPWQIRNERGREDKPLTSVLYSMQEGGELYGAIFFR